MMERDEAARILREQRAATLELIAAMRPAARTMPGLGGGDWSPTDLLGHLESWERHALDALEAWGADRPAPIDQAFRTASLHEINAREVARKAGRSFRAAASSAERTHTELLRAIEEMTDDRWHRPATSRARKPLGHRLGQILVGAGPFGHDAAHHPSLERFVADHAAPRR